MRFLGILILLNVVLCSTAFKLLHKAKNDNPRGFGTAKHAVIIGKFVHNFMDLLAKFENTSYVRQS